MMIKISQTIISSRRIKLLHKKNKCITSFKVDASKILQGPIFTHVLEIQFSESDEYELKFSVLSI
jgi:hypothetical protein